MPDRKPTTPLCTVCRWHRKTPYGRCHHPLTRPAWSTIVSEPLRQWLVDTPQPNCLPLAIMGIEIEAKPEALATGRFAWPFNFRASDLLRCDRFEEACANDR